MRKLLLLLATLPLLMGAAFHDLPVVDGVPDPVQITTELRARGYQSIERRLAKLQDDYEAGVGDELRVALAFDAFSNSDPALEALLLEFKARLPTSFVPPLALAYYQENLAWLSRGARVRSKTSAEQFKAMNEHAARAEGYYREALKLRPRLMASHAGLIRLTTRHGAIAQAQTVARTALALAPESYVVRHALLNAASPKWGGSMALVGSIGEEAEKHVADNPRLKSLRGFVEYTAVDVALMHKDADEDCAVVVDTLDKAIATGGHYVFYMERADARICDKQFEAAASDLTRALEQRPNNLYALSRRGFAYSALGRDQEALHDLNRAHALDPFYPKPLKTRGFLMYRTGRYAEAHSDFTRALIYADDDPAIHRQLAYIEFYKRKDYPLAQRRIQKAIELDDTRPEDWFVLTVSQWNKGGCDFVSSGERYLALCRGSGDCETKKHKWVESNVSQARKTNYCR